MEIPHLTPLLSSLLLTPLTILYAYVILQLLEESHLLHPMGYDHQHILSIDIQDLLFSQLIMLLLFLGVTGNGGLFKIIIREDFLIFQFHSSSFTNLEFGFVSSK